MLFSCAIDTFLFHLTRSKWQKNIEINGKGGGIFIKRESKNVEEILLCLPSSPTSFSHSPSTDIYFCLECVCVQSKVQIHLVSLETKWKSKRKCYLDKWYRLPFWGFNRNRLWIFKTLFYWLLLRFFISIGRPYAHRNNMKRNQLCNVSLLCLLFSRVTMKFE